MNDLDQQKDAIDYQEGQRLLFNSSIRAVPFNIIMATGIFAYLWNVVGIQFPIVVWFMALIVLSYLRILHCRIVLKKDLISNKNAVEMQLKIFLFFCMLTGLLWTLLYFVSLPYVTEAQRYVIVLTFGGMVAGGTTTLAVYFPAFLVYTFCMFIPPIIHNYLQFTTHQAILATMWLLYLAALSLIATANKSTLQKVFFLTEQNEILAEKFEELSITDPLTGLYNRRHFDSSIADEYKRAKTSKQTFTLISIDIDYFKLINDNFGHPFGDKFIIYTANFLNHYLSRANHLIFRLGGDEFIALLFDVSQERIKQICEEIVAQFKKIPRFEYDEKEDVKKIIDKISMSIGVVHVPHDSQCTVEQIIEKADKSLYQSKNEGKNQIHFSECD